MQVGSLVKCIGTFYGGPGRDGLFVSPIVGNIYTVRAINEGYGEEIGHQFITLTELVNPPQIWPNGKYAEAQFDIDGFVEILPPMDISIEELIKETEPCH